MNKLKEHSQALLLAELSLLLEYPDENFKETLDSILGKFIAHSPGLAEALVHFKKNSDGMSVEELEELYTRTFDLAPICVPYLSSYIYGDENFERGAFMSGLADAYAAREFAIAGELPDHLKLVLRFAPQFLPQEFQDLIEFCLLDVLEKMISLLKDARNPYYWVLAAARDLVVYEKERRRL